MISTTTKSPAKNIATLTGSATCETGVWCGTLVL